METEIKQFVEFIRLKGYSPATQKQRFQTLERFSRYMNESKHKKTVQEISLDDLNGYMTHLKEKQCSPYSIDTFMRCIQLFFDYLEKQQILLINPAERLEIPSLGNRLPKYILTEEEVKKLLAMPDVTRAKGLRNRAIMELLYSTGIRRSECCSLTVFDLDLENGYVRVNLGKGSKDRIVPLGKKACEYVKLYLDKVRSKWVTDPDCKKLFIYKYNNPLTKQAINVLLKTYGRKLKLDKPVTTHSFRRATATHMLRHGAGPLYLQRMLGHATTYGMKPYIKVTAVDLKEMHEKKHPRERRCSK